MANILTGTLRRTAPLVLGVSMVAFVAAACAEEDPSGVDEDGTVTSGLDSLGTPDTLGTPDLTSPGLSTPMAGASPDDGSPTSASLDDMTLDSIQAWFEQNAPEIDALAITGVDLSDGTLTIETEWDSTNEADATDLCSTALDIDITGTVTAVEVLASDGTTLAEC